jgi:DNA-binding NtrC family response regulator
MEIGPYGRELQIIKKLHAQMPQLRIISIGAEGPMENLIHAFKFGSNDFYKLPLNIDLLIERIDGIVKKLLE